MRINVGFRWENLSVAPRFVLWPPGLTVNPTTHSSQAPHSFQSTELSLFCLRMYFGLFYFKTQTLVQAPNQPLPNMSWWMGWIRKPSLQYSCRHGNFSDGYTLKEILDKYGSFTFNKFWGLPADRSRELQYAAMQWSVTRSPLPCTKPSVWYLLVHLEILLKSQRSLSAMITIIIDKSTEKTLNGYKTVMKRVID